MHSCYIPTDPGNLLLVVHLPGESPAPEKWVVHVPAFAEEMNKSRRMVAEQARRWSDAGYGVVIPDLYGSGDSSGDFGEASWSRWQRDIRSTLDWIAGLGGVEARLWGLRSGCLLAAEIAAGTIPAVPISGLILWQPVAVGRLFVNQFLRLRLASGMMSGKQETVEQLRQIITNEGELEVAGYRLSEALVRQMSALELERMTPPRDMPVDWFEVGGRRSKPLSPVASRIIDQWGHDGIRVSARTVVGEPFWSTQEISSAPELIEASTGILTGHSRADAARRRASREPFESHPINPGDRAAESSLTLKCGSEHLMAILHTPDTPLTTGVLLVVGGPQYRVGSHRQFVLLARQMAAAGIPVLRFDYRGMGDSSGTPIDFEEIDADIRAALDTLQERSPGLQKIVIWGLCDAASAACFYAPGDPRVSGLILLNPWVRSEQGIAKAHLKHYYRGRVLDPGLWKKMLSGKFDYGRALRSLFETMLHARRSRANEGEPGQAGSARPASTLADRFESSLSAYQGKVLFILSGNDLTAAEFKDAVNASATFSRLLRRPGVLQHHLDAADHTFSRSVWRDQVAAWSIDWVTLL